MNDWVILGLMVFAVVEAIYVFLRWSGCSGYSWGEDKFFSILYGIMFGVIHLAILTIDSGSEFVGTFYWHRLGYELFFILAIAAFFGANYLLSKLIDRIKN